MKYGEVKQWLKRAATFLEKILAIRFLVFLTATFVNSGTTSKLTSRSSVPRQFLQFLNEVTEFLNPVVKLVLVYCRIGEPMQFPRELRCKLEIPAA